MSEVCQEGNAPRLKIRGRCGLTLGTGHLQYRMLEAVLKAWHWLPVSSPSDAPLARLVAVTGWLSLGTGAALG